MTKVKTSQSTGARLPDFVIIGAMKCGTTMLFDQLGAQHGVFMTNPKEPFYFSDDDVFARGASWYAQLYSKAAPTDIKGEASTHYTMLPTFPDTVTRLRAAVENPRLIYVMRNPIHRTMSHYRHEWIERRISVDIATAIQRHPELIEYGRYGTQLAPFVKAFGKDAIMITSLELLKQDPAGEIARIGQHIGMKTTAVWHNDMKAKNISAERSRKIPFHNLLVSHPLSIKLRRVLVPNWLDQHIRKTRSPQTDFDLPETIVDRIMNIHHAESEDLIRMGIPGTREALISLNAVDKQGA